MSNFDNENGRAWTIDRKQKRKCIRIPQNLHHSNKIYTVATTNIILQNFKSIHEIDITNEQNSQQTSAIKRRVKSDKKKFVVLVISTTHYNNNIG